MAILSSAKYIIDTSSLLSQKPNELYKRSIYRTLWSKIDTMIRAGEIVTCSEIEAEVCDDDVTAWMKEVGITVLQIDDEIQMNVKEIVTTVNKELVDFKACKSSGDAFLIATAKKYNLTVITQERTNSPKKIPYTCKKMGIKCISLLEFMEENGIYL